MKLKITIILLFISITTFSQNRLWTTGTARTIPKGDVHLSMFYFSKYGVTQYFEIQSKPLWWIKYPNINGKFTWYYHKGQVHKNFLRSRDYLIGSIHGFNYPTWALRTAQRKGYVGGIIPPEAIIPSIFAFRNEILFTTIIKKRKTCYNSNFLVTLKLGHKFALKTGEATLPYFDNALYNRESAIYRDLSLYYTGIDFDAKLSYGLNYTVDLDFYSVGINTDNWSVEHKGLIYWKMGNRERVRIVVGYKLAYSNYTTMKGSISPFVDFTYMFHPRSNKHSQLFQKRVDRNGDIRDMFYRKEKKKKKDKKEKE